ncbi:MAG: flagellar biosynthesis protein FlgA, partial [Rhodanobacter sp.]
MTLRAALAAVGLVALLGSATAHAAATQSLDSVRAAAEQAMQDRYSRPGSRVVVSTEPLDTRLQLDACSEPLRALVSEQAQPRSRMTVPVQCPQPGGWIVRVPIQLQVF